MDEADDPENLHLWVKLNGECLQESMTGDLIFWRDEVVSFDGCAFTLVPDNMILTGAPPDVRAFRDPPIFLNGRDEITVGVVNDQLSNV